MAISSAASSLRSLKHACLTSNGGIYSRRLNQDRSEIFLAKNYSAIKIFSGSPEKEESEKNYVGKKMHK